MRPDNLNAVPELSASTAVSVINANPPCLAMSSHSAQEPSGSSGKKPKAFPTCAEIIQNKVASIWKQYTTNLLRYISTRSSH